MHGGHGFAGWTGAGEGGGLSARDWVVVSRCTGHAMGSLPQLGRVGVSGAMKETTLDDGVEHTGTLLRAVHCVAAGQLQTVCRNVV